MQSNRRVRRLNIKAIVATVVLLVGVPLAGVLISYGMRGRVRSEALAQVESLEKEGRQDLALRHVDQYLRKYPQDEAILRVQARLLYETANSFPSLEGAAAANDRVLRLDPTGPDNFEIRERIAEMYVRLSESVTAEGNKKVKRYSGEDLAKMVKFAPAIALLENCVTAGKAKASTYRLLGMAKEGQLRLTTELEEKAKRGSFTESELREIEAVREAYAKSLELDPKDIVTAIRLAEFNRSQGVSPEESDLLIRKTVASDPGSPEMQLAAWSYYRQRGDQAKAAEALKQAVAVAKPDNVAVTIARAESLLLDKKYVEAREALGTLPEIAWEQQTGPWLILGEAYFREGDQDKAITSWKDGLLKTRKSDVETLKRLASLYIERGQLEDAAPLIERLGRLASPTAMQIATILRGQFEERAGRFEQAVQTYEQALKTAESASLPDLYMGLGRSHQALNDLEAAERYFVQADNVAPQANRARVALANLKLKQGDSQAAARLMQSGADRSDDESVREVLARSLLLGQAGRPAAQRDWEEFDKVLATLPPQSEAADRLRVQKDLIEGDWKAAEAHATEALARWPRSTELWTNLADAVLRAGNPAGALSVLEKASEPSHAGDQAGFRIARSQLLSALGRGREALDLLSYSLGSMPPDQLARLHEARGRMYAARGDLSGAREAYAAWAKLQPGLPAPVLAKLDLAFKTGDAKSAEACVKELQGNFQEDSNKPYPYLFGLSKIEYLTKFPQAGARRLDDAKAIAKQMAEVDYPNDTRTTLAYARVLHMRGEEPEAIARYMKAWKGGQDEAIGPLVGLLVKAGREGEIGGLRRPGTVFGPTAPERLGAEFALAAGDKEQAAKLLAEVERGYPGSPGLATWRLGMLDRLGRSGDVEKDIEEEVARDPSRISSWVTLMRYQAARGRKAEARATLDRMISQASPKEKDLVRAQGLEAIGETDEAEKAYQALLAAPGAGNETLLSAARFFLDTNHADRAEPLLRKILASEPGNRAAARTLADSLSRLPELSEEAWRKAMDVLGPADSPGAQAPEERLTRALVLARHPDPGRRREAIPVLEGLVDDQPATLTLTAAAREALVKLYLADGKVDRAAEVAAVTATSSPNINGIALYVESLLQARNWAEAARQLDRLALLVPKDPNLAALRARQIEGEAGEADAVGALEAAVRERSGQPDEIPFAIAAVRRLAQLHPDGSEAEKMASELAAREPSSSWILAQLLATRKKYGESIEAARAPIIEGTADQAFEACRALLTVIQAEGPDGPDTAKADALFARSLERFPDLGGLKALRGMTHHMLGRFDQEIQVYKELVASHPDNPVYNNNLAWALCEAANNPEEALGHIDQAIRAFGRQPDLLDTRGVILTRLGRLDEAIVDLKEAADGAPAPSPVFLFHLARAYKLANQADLARAALAEGQKAGLTAASIESFERPDLEALSKL